jgi:hypothetical protein
VKTLRSIATDLTHLDLRPSVQPSVPSSNRAMLKPRNGLDHPQENPPTTPAKPTSPTDQTRFEFTVALPRLAPKSEIAFLFRQMRSLPQQPPVFDISTL